MIQDIQIKSIQNYLKKKFNMEPKLISGRRIYDNRGSLRFSNDLKFKGIKRFYMVHNYNT